MINFLPKIGNIRDISGKTGYLIKLETLCIYENFRKNFAKPLKNGSREMTKNNIIFS